MLESLQFFSTIVLLIAVGVVYSINGGNDRNIQNYEILPTTGPYVLRERFLTFMKQSSLLCNIMTCGGYFLWNVTNTFEYSTFSIITFVLYFLATVTILYLDSIRNLPFMMKKLLWVICYLIVVIYNSLSYMIQPNYWYTLLMFISSVSTFLFAILCAVLDKKAMQINPPNAEYTCNLFDYLTFSYLNVELIQLARQKKKLDFTDVPSFVDADSAEQIWDRFKLINSSCKNKISLTYSLFLLVQNEWYSSGVFQFIGSCSLYAAPLALERILLHLSNHGSDDDEVKALFPVNIHMAVLILFLGPLIKSIGDGQNYARGRHIGIRIKAALIGSIFNKALTVDLAGSKESVGKLNNLISVDVTDIQNFCCYTHYLWSCLLEIAVSIALLFLVLGHAAWGGIFIMVLSLFACFHIQKRMEVAQTEMLLNKDIRMGIINEVLNSIRIIKFFAWEVKFMEKITDARKLELLSLKAYALCQASFMVIWEVVPALVGASAFIMHTYILGKTLTPATGFTALALFNLLRGPLASFPEMVNYMIRANIALGRIQSFLNSNDVKGMPERSGRNSNDTHSNINTTGNNDNTGKQPSAEGYVEMRNVTLAWPPVRNADPSSSEKSGVKSAKYNNSFSCMELGNRLTMCSTSCFPDRSAVMSCFNRTNDDSEDRAKKAAPLIDRTVVRHSGVKRHGNYKPVTTGDTEDETTESSSPFTIEDEDEETGGFESEPDDASSMYGMIVLDDISFTVAPNSLAVIVGMTGSGKSTLLQGGLLGECKHLQGMTVMNGSLSYVTQSPWIQNATLRDNVLFGLPYEKDRYEKVLFACSLVTDLKLLPLGDMTEIGEKGINLSGGQQQRVSLARAAYAKTNIILLDDPLSAVDSHVGEHIFRELILGFLSDRTRVLVSHNLSLTVPSADTVICIDNNYHKIVACCPPSELSGVLRSNKTLTNRDTGGLSSFWEGLLSVVNSASRSGSGKSHLVETKVDSPESIPQNCSYENVHEAEISNALAPTIPQRHRGESFQNVMLTSASAGNAPTLDVTTSAPDTSANIVQDETKSAGDIPWSVYWYYIKAGGGALAFGFLFAGCVFISLASLYNNYALGTWMTGMENDSSNTTDAMWLYMLSVFAVFVGTCFKMTLEVLVGLKASQQTHDQLIHSVVLAPTSWFDATPIGRIINRFSQDISSVDTSTMYNLSSFVVLALGTAQIVAVISFVLPLLLLPFIPVIAFTVWVAYQYLMVSRELKRLESLKQSPVFVLFSESLAGLSVIRSFRHESRFFKICCERVNEMNQCHLYLWLCNRWLNFRMQVLGSLVAGCVGWAVIAYEDKISSTAAAIVIIYSLTFCDYLTFLARSHADCQMTMNSVDRIQEYSSLESEQYMTDLRVGSSVAAQQSTIASQFRNKIRSIKSKATTTLSLTVPSSPSVVAKPKGKDIEMGAVWGRHGFEHQSGASTPLSPTDSKWPSEGRVEFNHIVMQYKSSPSPVLRDISFAIPGKLKVGVVGRTGAGKSSLIAALFRLVEPTSGEILIDGVNVLDIPLHNLRNNIAIVPQDPTLFKGSVRFNLDTFSQHTDEELWNALRSVHLADHIASMENDLSNSSNSSNSNNDNINSNGAIVSELDRKSVSEKGGNFSVGQRQLLCMARAILRNAAVLVLDECTASVDHETDSLIQETVRNQLVDTTVICIAHRLRTIAYYDLVLVMDQGTVAELDHPYILMCKDDSVFKNMCKASGEFEELLHTAKGAYESEHENSACV